MQFLYPGFLWALCLLAIPIIIHLFYFRRFKKVYFTNVKFLKEIKEETSSRNKIKNWLILLMRLLALSALILAFAQPFLPVGKNVQIGKRTISIFIDNSFSMEAKASDELLFQRAREKAREVIKAQEEVDLIQVLTHDFEGRHQRLVQKEEALSLLDEIEITPSVKPMSSILSRQRQCLNQEAHLPSSIYFISDFQKDMCDVPELRDTLNAYYFLPLESIEQNNVSIDTAWFTSPVVHSREANRLIIKVSNRGQDDAENVRLAINHDNQEKPISVKTISGNTSIYDTFNLSVNRPGWQSARIVITDHPISFDDEYFIAFNVKKGIKILEIYGQNPNKYIRGSAKGMGDAELTSTPANQVDYAKLSSSDLVVLNQLSTLSTGLSNELIKYLQRGGNVAFFPAAGANVENYNSFFRQCNAATFGAYELKNKEVGRLNNQEFVFRNVFSSINKNIKLPFTKGSFARKNRSRSAESVLLRYRDGSSYLSKYNVKMGRLYICSSPLDVRINSLVKNAEVFVPLIYKMAISKSAHNSIANVIGKDEVIELNKDLPSSEKILEVEGDITFIPAIINLDSKTAIDVHGQIKKSGVWEVKSNEEIIEKLAFNYDRSESKMHFLSKEDLKNKYGSVNIIDQTLHADLGQALKERERGKSLWRWMLVLSLIFLAIEQIIIRFWKQ